METYKILGQKRKWHDIKYSIFGNKYTGIKVNKGTKIYFFSEMLLNFLSLDPILNWRIRKLIMSQNKI